MFVIYSWIVHDNFSMNRFMWYSITYSTGDADGGLGVSFLDAVNIRIYYLLKDKEKATMVASDNWLHVEVAPLVSVKKAGNFR